LSRCERSRRSRRHMVKSSGRHAITVVRLDPRITATSCTSEWGWGNSGGEALIKKVGMMHGVDGLLVVSIHEDVVDQGWDEVEQKEGGNVVPRMVAPRVDTFCNDISLSLLSLDTRRTLFGQLFGVGNHCVWPRTSALTIFLNHERSLSHFQMANCGSTHEERSLPSSTLHCKSDAFSNKFILLIEMGKEIWWGVE